MSCLLKVKRSIREKERKIEGVEAQRNDEQKNFPARASGREESRHAGGVAI